MRGTERLPNEWLAFAAVLVLAAALRLPGLGHYPPGINQDEAARAYDAFCLAATGQDHNGAKWPIFLRTFGAADYPPGTYVYLLIPFQAIFGMNVWSTRLPAALLGTANVFFLYWLVRRFYGPRAGLLSAFLLAISPWHIQLSRMAFEVSLCIPLVTLGFFLLSSLCRTEYAAKDARGSPVWRTVRLIAGGFSLGLALWTYNAYRVVVPLLLVGLLLLYPRQALARLRDRRTWPAAAAIATGFLLGLSPFIYATVTDPAHAWARAVSVTSTPGSRGALTLVGQFISTYGLHFSPAYLFFEGDPSLRQSVPGYGQLHYFSMVLLPLGLWRLLSRWRTEPAGRYVLWWILAGPVPAALTTLEAGHALRSGGSLPAWQVLSALGLDWALEVLSSRVRLRRAVATVSALAIIGCTARFLYIFLVVYPAVAGPMFQTEWPEVFADVKRLEHDYPYVLLTSESNQLGMLYLFYNQVDPRTSRPEKVPGEEWDAILKVDKHLFISTLDLPALRTMVQPGDRLLIADRERNLVPGAREIKRYHYPDGQLAVILFEITFQPDAVRPQ